MTAAVHWSKKVERVAELGQARTAVVTVIEGAVKAVAAVGKSYKGIGTLGVALRNWGRFECLFFAPKLMSVIQNGKQFGFRELNVLSYSGDAFQELFKWTLHHGQIQYTGSPVHGAIDLVERISCIGLLIANVFGIEEDKKKLTPQGAPNPYPFDESTFKTSIRLQIAMKLCFVADASLRLVAKEFRWYKTADITVRVTGSVLYLLYLWIDPTSRAYVNTTSNSPGPGDDGKGKDEKKNENL